MSRGVWQQRATAAMVIGCVLLAARLSAAASENYTVNGHAVAPEMRQLLVFHGFSPGHYYVDVQGNYGKRGAPPMGNVRGGPATGWRGEPQGIAGNAYAQAYVNGVTGIRVFWVYSPSIFSEAKGGSSGYYHICPDNIYYRSSEGAVSVGGGRGDYGWGGVAGTHQGGGRWSIQSSVNGPVLALNGSDGHHRVLISTMLQGRWKAGQTTYVVEQNKASCR